MASQPWIITPAELKNALNHVTLVDVREPEEFAEGKIECSKLLHIPLGELQDRAKEVPASEDIVVYCAHGVRSLQGLMILKQLGFPRVRSLEGGIVAYDES